MPTPRTSQQRPLVVATAGLGLLVQTRLKAACALLMADRLHIEVVPWRGGGAGVLIADIDTDAGRDAHEQATRAGLPVLAISRTAEPLISLSPNTTVKDLAHALKLLIQSTLAERTERTTSDVASALLDKLRLDEGNEGWWLLDLGLTRVVVDLSTRHLHLLRHVSLDNLLREAANPQWHASALDEATWLDHYQRDISASVTIESFWWRLTATSPSATFAEPADEAHLQLTAWPELDPQATDPALLLPLAYLMHGSWSASDIARMTGLSRAQSAHLLGIVAASGLARGLPAQTTVSVSQDSAGSLGHALMKVARRFGLLFGARHV